MNIHTSLAILFVSMLIVTAIGVTVLFEERGKSRRDRRLLGAAMTASAGLLLLLVLYAWAVLPATL